MICVHMAHPLCMQEKSYYVVAVVLRLHKHYCLLKAKVEGRNKTKETPMEIPGPRDSATYYAPSRDITTATRLYRHVQCPVKPDPSLKSARNRIAAGSSACAEGGVS